MLLTIAFWCFFMVAFFWMLSGVAYLFSPRLLPHHLDAIGSRWEDLPSEARFMFLMFLKGGGAGMLAVATALSLILFIPFRAGEPWSRWAFLTISAVGITPLFYVIYQVREHTLSSPPWRGAVVSVILMLAGFFLSAGLGR